MRLERPSYEELEQMVTELKEENRKHRQAEEQLRKSEDKYRTLIENLPQKIFLKDKNSVYVSCNENYARDLKINPNEITGKTDREFWPKELADKYITDDKKVMELGKTEHIEEQYIQMGKERYVQTVKTPVKDENNNVIGVLGIFWDITERKLMEEELKNYRDHLESLVIERTAELYETNRQLQQKIIDFKQAEEETRKLNALVRQEKDRLLALVNSMNDEVWFIDTQRRFTLLNPFRHRFDPDSGEWVDEKKLAGKLEIYRHDGSIRPLEESPALRALQGEVIENLEEIIRIPTSGELRYRSVNAAPVKNNSGDIIGSVSVVRDITERKQVEKALIKSETRTRALNEQILNMLMVVSHDLRSPLVAVEATLKLLMRGIYGQMDTSVKNTVIDLHDRIQGLLGVAEDCLGKVSGVTGNVDFTKKLLDLREDIIDPVLDELLGEMEKQNIVIDNRLGAIPTKRIPIKADKVWLKIVFRNLFNNAIKYGGKGCEIAFGCEDCGSYYKLNVYNSGAPIADDVCEKLFTKFNRNKAEGELPSEGMGLGLYLTKKIIRNHGGDIWYEPKEGGANFVLTLPNE